MTYEVPATIDPGPPQNPALDFFLLKRRGTALVQALAGEIWTDYNEHDPGVTTLEQLAYALTELAYRADLPMADLLTQADGVIDAERQALHPASSILTCNPATIADYRKLLVDRIRGLANVWVDALPWRGDLAPGGLYRIAAYAPGLDPRCDQDRVCALAREVGQVYAARRNLCEDLVAVQVLAPLPVEVHGDVMVGDCADAEETLAEIFFQLGNTLAPELRRRPLDELLARGDSPGEIFDGPLLHHGFFDDEALQPKARCFTARGLAQVIRQVDGVTGVRTVAIAELGRPAKPRLDVPTDEIAELRIQPWHNSEDGCPSPVASARAKTAYTLRLWRRGVRLCPDARRVERCLDRRWRSYRRLYPLWPQYNEAFAMPVGRYRDVAAYESIQNQYPGVYGIGEDSLADSATDSRKAQAKQLKGYLLAFEQLMADGLAQLAHAKDLFAADPALDRTYFFQFLDRCVPGVGPLLRPPSGDSPGYRKGLQQLVRSQDPWVERRERFLDLLLALYGERLGGEEVWGGSAAEASSCHRRSPPPAGSTRDGSPGERRIAAEIELLRRLVRATADRARAVDRFAPLSVENSAGMQLRLRIQLGYPLPPHVPLGESLDGLGVELVASAARATIGRPLGRRSDEVESSFDPVPPARLGTADSEDGPQSAIVLEPDRGDRVKPSIAGHRLQADLTGSAADFDNLRIGVFDGDHEHSLVCRNPVGDRGGWCLLERCEDRTRAWIAACAWQRYMGWLADALQQLYLVEHLLLRDAMASDPAPFDTSFTLSVVLSGPPSTLGDPAWRDFVRRAVRSSTPAHVMPWTVFIEPREMVDFEHLYWPWRDAIRDDDPDQRRKASIALRDWLIRHRPDGERDPDPGADSAKWTASGVPR